MARPRNSPKHRGQFKKGQSGNPGGLSREQKEARKLLDADLDTPDMREAFLKGYRKALVKANPMILVDYANRKLGKVPDKLNVDGNLRSNNPAAPLTTEQLIAIARAHKPEP